MWSPHLIQLQKIWDHNAALGSPWDQVKHFLMDANLVHKIIKSSKTFTPIIWWKWAQISKRFPPTHLGPHNSYIQIDRANSHAQDPREAIPCALEVGNHSIQAPKWHIHEQQYLQFATYLTLISLWVKKT